MTDLPTLRAAAYRYLDAGHDGTTPRRWRTVITDSESLTGYGPVCPDPGHPGIPDIGIDRDETGVYDCCPPITETYSEGVATYMVELLNADAIAALDADRMQRYEAAIAAVAVQAAEWARLTPADPVLSDVGRQILHLLAAPAAVVVAPVEDGEQ
ncbi:hypothetical protein [Streptacidiphilus carbonis]|uniref:hypothetical protein n=1 Tax=Streptacidiphilus carbonis TaxID=105422 RepID=UPI000694AC78|nr:hypothetical protein [Streptacidiphilus carbonis]